MTENAHEPLHVVDLHCDLLAYLVMGEGRSLDDPPSRCSLPQMKAGRVALQVLAIFVPPMRGMSALGTRQAEIFAEQIDSGSLWRLERADQLVELDSGRPAVIAAIEGGAAFCEEDEPLKVGLERFAEIERRVGRLLYTSLTWNHENRFGGGTGSRVGLKDDGRNLLDLLAEKRIAVDLSHASHWLAADILEYLDAAGYDLPVLASHSCFAALVDIPRNLPDDIAREIIARGGVIGLNLLNTFNPGEAPEAFVEQARHAKSLGGTASFALGADFFCPEDVPPELRSDEPDAYFYPGFGDASCYPRLLEALAEGLDDEEALAAIAHRNVQRFVGRVLA